MNASTKTSLPRLFLLYRRNIYLFYLKMHKMVEYAIKRLKNIKFKPLKLPIFNKKRLILKITLA